MIHTDGTPTIACRVVSASGQEEAQALVPGLVRPASVPTISEDSLLQMDRFEGFRIAYAQAAADPSVAIALSRITPEQTYSLYEALKAGEPAAR